ncbi:MAG: TonB-dependent receptor [Chitinophagaceae bacterium]
MRKMLSLVIATLLFAGQLAAQSSRTITGKVADASGNPIPNASVVVKGTTNGTTSKPDGTYSVTVPADSKILVISAVGYAPYEVSIGNKGIINASLESNEKNLQEVVVVGYGTQQKKSFTGSAAKIDAKEFANLVTPSVDKQLAGRATGVQVTSVGGGVNTPARIRIRGTASLSQGNDPLIVVDGVPILSGNLAGTTNSNALGDINPSDIESLDVLKDGSATAIYGSRAAAGVILITTKKGAKGRAKINYDGFVGFSSALKKFDVLNAKQFETIANEKLSNAGLAARAGVNASADTSDTDWQKNVMINNALANSHTLSMQGGGDKTTYYFSLNYAYQKGIIISNYNRAYRVRLNIEHEANKFFKLGSNLSVSRQEDGDQNNGSNALGGAIASSLRQLPNVSPYSSTHFTGYNINYPISSSMTPGPNSQTVDDNFSNVAFTLRNNKYYSDKYRIVENAFVEISPVKGLKVRSQVGIDMLNDYSFQGLSPYHGDAYGTPAGGTNGSLYNVTQNWLRLVWSNYFNYNLTLAKYHNFMLTGGTETQKETYKWFSATGTNISDVFFIKENLISGVASIQSVGGNYDVRGFQSFFGRLNYDFANKYFAQATIRRDGQSALAPGKRYGNFPGFSVGWRPSEEKFWQNSLGKVINEAKLKASYAKVGNTLSNYPYLSTYGSAAYGNLSGISPSSIGNPELRWETSAKYDIGIELGILNNRFNLTADWFLNDVDNLVLAVPMPPSAGVPGSSINQNIGKLKNKGIELSVNGTIISKKDFTWDVNVNYSSVKNKIVSLYEIGGQPVLFIENGSYNLIRVGDPMNIIYGYDFAGVNPANGNPMYNKSDGTLVQLNLNSTAGTVGSYYLATKGQAALGTQSSLSASTDRKNLGQGIPTWFGAFTNTFNYKGIGLEIMLRYSGGNKIMNYTRQEVLMNQSFQNNGTEILERWTTVGQETNVPKLYFGQGNNINLTSSANSRFVEKGDYLRLQNVVLSYTLNSKLLDTWTKGYVRSVKLYAQGQNLHVWTKYKGADPDNISAAGVDAAVAPQVRTVSFGLSVGF